MTIISAILVAILFTGGSFLLFRRPAFNLVLGMALLSVGTNILLISMGGWDAASHPPFLHGMGHSSSSVVDNAQIEIHADPLPQALILTALVIGFGFLSLLMALVMRSEEESDGFGLTEDDAGQTGSRVS
jgi:multicomponent Na+:H+ antiporter subunit C